MKMIIYKKLDTYYITNEKNYYAPIQNAKEIQELADFENPQEIIDYYCKYFNCNENDFIIIE